MAAKTLSEAIAMGICTGPLYSLPQNLENELKDFLAHSPARYCNKMNRMDQYETLSDFINDIIKDLPKPVKKDDL